MDHDIFFSISQTPDHEGHIPSEETMLKNYFQQLNLADELGFGVGWIAQSHLSTETQKSNSKPVVPHWKGEVGLCTDFPQLALESFSQTNSIEIGSAVVSILASGGPIAQAERIANTLQLLAVKGDTRKLHVGSQRVDLSLWLGRMASFQERLQRKLLGQHYVGRFSLRQAKSS